MNYPGGKNHVYQKIINLIPPHRVYIECFAGSGAILRNKKPATAGNIAIDTDASALANIAQNNDGAVQLVQADALEWLRAYLFQGDEFVYVDPPYLMSTRRQHRHIYRYEMGSEAQHYELLLCLRGLPCKVMLSGYWSELYNQMLTGWYTVSFETVTRGGGKATEWLWMNYPKPLQLHEYTYLGDNFRERERIKRKKARWVERLKRMDIHERQALLAAVGELAIYDGVGPC
jgi:site-specific DNA-adenine methylase